MAILIILFIGFYKSYFGKLPTFDGLTSTHHVHLVLLLLWFAMLILQPILIYQKRPDLHKLVGNMSYVLVPLMVWSMLGVMNAQYVKNVARMPEEQNLAFLYLPTSALIPFITLYVLAIIYQKKPAIHMRYMIASSVALLGRINFGFQDFNTAVMFASALCDVFLVGLLVYESIKGKNYRPYLISLAICVVFHNAFPWFPASTIWQGPAKGLVQYVF